MPDPMSAVQFFEHPHLEFPIEHQRDEFEWLVWGDLERYHDLINNMNPEDNITRRIRDELGKIVKLSGLLRNAVHEYMRGLPHKAYACLDEGIKSVRSEFGRCISTNVDHLFLNELYRMRAEPEPGTTFK